MTLCNRRVKGSQHESFRLSSIRHASQTHAPALFPRRSGARSRRRPAVDRAHYRGPDQFRRFRPRRPHVAVGPGRYRLADGPGGRRHGGNRARHGLAGDVFRLFRAAVLRLGPGAAARHPDLSFRLCLGRGDGFHRAGTDAHPFADRRRDHPRLLVPRPPQYRRRSLRHEPCALPLRLFERQGLFPHAVGRRRLGGAGARRLGAPHLFRGHPATFPSGHRRRRHPGADGGGQRSRCRSLFRRQFADRHPLCHLAQPLELWRCGTAGARHRPRDGAADLARKHGAQGRIPARPARQPHAAAAHDAERLGRCGRRPRLHPAGRSRLRGARRRSRLSRPQARRQRHSRRLSPPRSAIRCCSAPSAPFSPSLSAITRRSVRKTSAILWAAASCAS